MLRQFLSGAASFDLPLIATGLFVAMFVVVLLRACQRSRGAEYRRLSALPLQDDATPRRTP